MSGFDLQKRHRWLRNGQRAAMRAVGVSLLLLSLAAVDVQAQDALLEALREQRQRVRTAEVLNEIGARAPAHGPVEIAVFQGSRQISIYMPVLPTPVVALPEIRPRPEPPPPEVASPVLLTEIRWKRTSAGEEDVFMDRFREALWTSVTGPATGLDTMSTPAIRARLQTVFGAPTRSPVARTRPRMQAGSEFVQFEYWFVVNGDIPFVVMDRNGPFGRGLVMIGDEDQSEILEIVRQDLIRQLLVPERLMPYVDYFQSRDDSQWYRTGFDGQQYYVIATERPRWARRGQQRGRWYDFR